MNKLIKDYEISENLINKIIINVILAIDKYRKKLIKKLHN